jgi:hypothetical protein
MAVSGICGTLTIKKGDSHSNNCCRFVKPIKSPEVTLDPEKNSQCSLATMRALAREINLSHHGQIIQLHVLSTKGGTSWHATLVPLNGQGVIEYLQKNLSDLVAVEYN